MRRDWSALKREYLSLQWPTLKAFAAEKGLPIETVKKAAMRDKWNEERTEVERQAEQKAIQETVESEAVKIRRVREENFKAHTTVLAGALRTMKNPAYTEKNPAQAVKYATEGRMLALGQPSEHVRVDAEEPPTEEELTAALAQAIALTNKKRGQGRA